MVKPWVQTPNYTGICRRTPNGSNKLIWTIMVSACSAVFIGLMAWMTSMNQHLIGIDTTEAARGERIASVESLIKTVDNRLTHIENKLDFIVEHQAK